MSAFDEAFARYQGVLVELPLSEAERERLRESTIQLMEAVKVDLDAERAQERAAAEAIDDIVSKS